MQDEVTRELEMPAPPEEVWRWLTEPELLGLWLGTEAEPGDAGTRGHRAGR